jgi:hypothetical protein
MRLFTLSGKNLLINALQWLIKILENAIKFFAAAFGRLCHYFRKTQEKWRATPYK